MNVSEFIKSDMNMARLPGARRCGQGLSPGGRGRAFREKGFAAEAAVA